MTEEFEQSDFSHPNNSFRAQAVIDVIEQFLTTLTTRAGDEHMFAVITEGAALRGQIIGQTPERFIEDELIWPMLRALGHEYRPRPTGLEGIPEEVPDFTLLGLGVPVIGEVKTPNDAGNARKESFHYLSRIDAYPAVSIATDGFTWLLHRVEEEGTTPVCEAHCELRRTVNQIKIERRHDHAERRTRRGLRQQLPKFVRQFSVEAMQMDDETPART